MLSSRTQRYWIWLGIGFGWTAGPNSVESGSLARPNSSWKKTQKIQCPPMVL